MPKAKKALSMTGAALAALLAAASWPPSARAVAPVSVPVAKVAIAGQGSGVLAGATNMVVANAVSPLTGDRGASAVAAVPASSGQLVAGNVLVANSTDAAGHTGQGATIVQVDPAAGTRRLFFQGGFNPVAVGPLSISIDPANDTVWVASRGPSPLGLDSNVSVISPSGTLLASFDETALATGGLVPTLFGLRCAVVVDSAGTSELLWSQYSPAGASLWRAKIAYSSSGVPSLSGFQPIDAALAFTPTAGPQGLAIDPATGTAYLADSASGQLLAFPGATGAGGSAQPQPIYSGPPLSSPASVAITNSALWVGNTDNSIVGISPGGRILGSFGALPNSAPGSLSALDATSGPARNTLWFADSASSTLHALRPAGYLMASADGHVFAFGTRWAGSPAASHQAANVVGIAQDRRSGGYWLATRNGRVLAWGAPSYATPQDKSGAPKLVGIAADARSNGYWLATAAGNVYNVGGAPWLGSLAGKALPAPVVGIASGAGGAGYYLVLANGQVLNFGVKWWGSTHVEGITTPIVGIASPALGDGYWLYSAGGQVFNFGIPSRGSLAGTSFAGQVSSMAATPSGNGYYLFTSAGQAYAFGAPLLGSPSPPLPATTWVGAAD